MHTPPFATIATAANDSEANDSEATAASPTLVTQLHNDLALQH